MEEQTKKTIISSTFIIIFLTFVGYVVSLVAQSLIAKHLGAGPALDAFVAAAVIPEFVFGLTNALFLTSFVVVYPEYSRKYGESAGKIFVSKLFTLACIGLVIITFFLLLFSPLIAMLIAPGFSAEQLSLTVFMIRILSLTILFFGLSSLFTGILYYEHEFFTAKILRILLSLGTIVCLLFLEAKIGSKSLALGMLIGIAFGCFLQYARLRQKGYFFRFLFDKKDKYVKEIFLLSLPLFFSTILYYLTKSIANMFASTLGHGSVSILNYAFLIVTLPVVFFSGAVTASIFPHMARQSAYEKREEISMLFQKALRILVVVVVPLTFVFMILGTDIVKILFERGEFTASTTEQVAGALFFFAIGLVPATLWGVILNVFYALKKMKAQALIYISYFSLNILSALIFIKFLSYNGIALAVSIAYWGATLLAFCYITRQLHPFSYLALGKSFLKILLASLGMAACLFFLRMYIGEYFMSSSLLATSVTLFVPLLIGALLYIGILWVLRAEELGIVIEALKKGIEKNKHT